MNKTILIADDDALFVLSIKAFLEENRYSVNEAHSGEQALEIVRKGDIPDLILMDLDFGEGRMDGAESVSRIYRLCDVPVVFFTAHNDRETIAKTKALSKYGYLYKPAVNETFLLATIDTVFSLYDARAKLQKSECQLKEAERLSHLGHYEIDVESGEALWSDETFRIFGFAPGTFAPTLKNYKKLIHPDDSEKVYALFYSCLKEKRTFDSIYRIKTTQGETRFIHSIGKIETDTEGKVSKMFGTLQDITEHMQTEERIRKSLMEKDILFKELKHRVKNNMMLIHSLLSYEMQKISDPHADAVLLNAQNRISTMIQVYEKLYGSEDLQDIALHSYVEDISRNLLQSYSIQPERIKLELYTEEIYMELKKAVSCGLILNELISNALRYAFPQGRRGVIRISARKINNNKEVEIQVRDNGVGFQPTMGKPHRLGLELVSILAEQLDGQLHRQTGKGTCFTLVFSLD